MAQRHSAESKSAAPLALPGRAAAAAILVAYAALSLLLAATAATAIVRLIPRLPTAWGEELLRKGPGKIMIRSWQIALAALLPWVLRRLGWRGWSDLGFRPETRPAGRAELRYLALGVLMGFCTMLPLFALRAALGARTWVGVAADALTIGNVLGSVGAACAVALFEETLARGVFFRVPARIWGAWPAAIVGSAIFSLAHFVEANEAAFEQRHFVGTVASLLRLEITANAEFWVRASNLMAAGILLCALVMRTGSTWCSIGLHGAWVFCIQWIGDLTKKNATGAAPLWLGARADGTDSLLALGLMLGLTWIIVRGPPRWREPQWSLWCWRLLCATTAAIPFSIALGEFFGTLTLLTAGMAVARRQIRVRFPAMFWFAVAFSIIAILSVVWGSEPARVLKKTGRLVWFLLIPISATLATPTRSRQLLVAFIGGTTVLALKTLVLNSWRAWHPHKPALAAIEGFYPRMVELSSMTSGQMMMLGLLITVAMFPPRASAAWIALLTAQLTGLILHFKRGSWLAAGLVLGAHGLRRRFWKWALVGVAICAALLCWQPVRTRVGALRRELDVDGGGRLTMWLRITPALIRVHPWGIGYRSVTPEMLQRVCPRVERKRNHLHSNLPQVLVETGWLGASLYVWWMGWACALAFRRRSEEATHPHLRAWRWMLVGLLLNGLVEYNFGDTELMITLSLILGALSAPRGDAQ